MTRSAPAASAASTEGVISASSASPFSCVVLPRETPFSTSRSEYPLPRSAAAWSTSFKTTSMPAFAHT